jgi:hypothetical protein
MGTYYGSGNAISIFNDGKTLTTGAGSASQALSAILAQNGVKARLVSVCCTAAAHINFTVGAGTATSDSYLITTTRLCSTWPDLRISTTFRKARLQR